MRPSAGGLGLHLVYSTGVEGFGQNHIFKNMSSPFGAVGRGGSHRLKHTRKQTVFISTLGQKKKKNVVEQKKHRQFDSVPSRSKYTVSLFVPFKGSHLSTGST